MSKVMRSRVLPAAASAPGQAARKSLNIESSLGDAVLQKLVEARVALPIVELGKVLAEQLGITVANAYRMTKAAIDDLRYLDLVSVDRSATMVALTTHFETEYRQTLTSGQPTS